MRQIRASTEADLRKLCAELELWPTSQIRGITLEVDGEAVLIVGYDGWTDGSVVMHQWCKHPKYYGRDMLRTCFRFPFEAGGVQTVIGTVRSDKPQVLDLNKRLGFIEAAVIPNAYGVGVDLHLLHLPRNQCKWYQS